MSEYLNTTPIYRNMWESSPLSGFNPMAFLNPTSYVSGWGNTGGYNWGGFSWNGFSGTSNSSTSTDSTAEYKDGKYYKSYKDYEKAKAELDKAKAEKKVAEEQLIAQKKEIKTAITTVDDSIKQIKKSKKKDGSAVVAESRKDMTWGQRALRTATNMGKGILNTLKGVIGYEADGKWNWKKCLKNVAITAAAVGACFIPVVGPAIGVALAATGVAAGTVGIVKSSIELSKAETDAEKDKAQQNLGANIFTTVSSALGLKGMGKAFRTSSVTSGTAGATTAANNGSKLAAAGRGISNFFKDMTVNAWKGMKQNIANDKAAVVANGFWKTFGSKLSNAFKSNYHTEKFERKKNDLLRSLEERIQKIDNEISVSKTAKEELLLVKEKQTISSIIRSLKRLKKKSSWDALSDNKKIKELAKAIESLKKSKNKDLLETIKRISKESDDLLNKLDELANLKLKSMREKAWSSKKYESDLDSYTRGMTLESHWWKPKFGNKYKKLLGKNSAYGATLRAVGNAAVAPAGVPAKVMNTLVWPMTSEYGVYMDADTVAAQLESLEAQKAELEAALKEAEKSVK